MLLYVLQTRYNPLQGNIDRGLTMVRCTKHLETLAEVSVLDAKSVNSLENSRERTPTFAKATAKQARLR